MGFATEWINLVMHCISSVSYTVNFNGFSSDRFSLNGGCVKTLCIKLKSIMSRFWWEKTQLFEVTIHRMLGKAYMRPENYLKMVLVGGWDRDTKFLFCKLDGCPVGPGKIQATTANSGIEKVLDLIDQSAKTWKVELIKSLFTPMEAHAICCIPLSIYTIEDKMVWCANNSGRDFGEIVATTNKSIMEGKRQSVQDICSIIFNIIREMRELRNKIPAQKPSQEPFVKVNFDAVFKATLHHSYSDFVIRNSIGSVMGSRTVLNKFVSDPFIAEAITSLQALNFSREMGFSHVQMEGDSLTTIHISFHHVDRRANMVAHMIAKERILLPEDRFWVEELPAMAEAFLARDLSGLIPQT
ncbi:hypothetical protein CXB51_023444 [Gossypium anomalum]|uniref:RNase H type-1 domain-containing protein n=1 Tax=Gossypium anomalum TaxID=47600 RepID=A0A8J6CXE9_9ROSI|nr:hypothetical protein CXB51_023444 [Gossypium anomalum]